MKYILAVLVMTFSMHSNADSWLCIMDKATGFNLENGSWKLAKFKFEAGDKYMIKETDAIGTRFGSVYQVHRFGSNTPSWLCGDFGSNEDAKELLVCDGYAVPGDTFKYNPRTGHFLATHTNGYVHNKFSADGVSTDTPIVMIGKCSKL
jgi:hypothetical protein